jgi:[acyl-carrier-protein] S-malonyltransferase
MPTRAFVFPGQGSQTVGMGVRLAQASAAARGVFERVDDTLKTHLSRLMRDGPADELTLTHNAQPAIMASSLAVMAALEQEAGVRLADRAAFVAGHSLGEYSALCAAGTLTLEQTARLLRLRGEAMQAAVPVGVGAMAALLGVDRAEADAIARKATTTPEGATEVCSVANDNAPGQIVVSGHTAAVARAIAGAKARGRKAMSLPVSAPFHCALMQPAADRMAEALAEQTLMAPFVPVLANVTAAPVSTPDAIRDLLVAQVTGVVRWRESIETLVGLGVDTFVEIGTGKVLSGMIKRIARDATTFSIETPEDIEAFLATL